jgi:alkylation response protein AidB-like acyl-CoA dehydrogenase
MSVDAVAAAASIRPVAAAGAERAERATRLTPELVEALATADLFRLCVPRSLGGREAEAGDVVRAIEELARGDGAAGWCLMIAATSGLISGWLDPDAAREVFGDPRRPCGGVFAPRGRALAVQGGYQVSGRWAFASGVEHSAWMLGGCVALDGERPRVLSTGAPDVTVLAWPSDELELLETWSVTGLRGTGSHDMQLEHVFVPSARAVSLFSASPIQEGPLYAFPIFGLLAAGVAAVAVGIARQAIQEFAGLAGATIPSMSRRSLAEHPAAQATVAQAHARVEAARALLHDALGQAWERAVERREVDLERRAALRLAATHAASESASAVTAVYHAAGGSSIYTSSPLERRFRDVHALRQHMIIGSSTWELAGRVLLGADVDASML